MRHVNLKMKTQVVLQQRKTRPYPKADLGNRTTRGSITEDVINLLEEEVGIVPAGEGGHELGPV